MQQRVPGKVLRAILIAIVLAIVVVSGASDEGRCDDVIDCNKTYDDYLQADFDYEIARQLHFYDNPTTCQTDCQRRPNPPPNCVQQCQIDRHTAFNNADIALHNYARGTCPAYEMDECAIARAREANCFQQHNFYDYADPEERLAVWSQYAACREASKVDGCQ